MTDRQTYAAELGERLLTYAAGGSRDSLEGIAEDARWALIDLDRQGAQLLPVERILDGGFVVQGTHDVDLAYDRVWAVLRNEDDYSASEVIDAFAGSTATKGRGRWLDPEDPDSDDEVKASKRWQVAAADTPNPSEDMDVVFIVNGDVW